MRLALRPHRTVTLGHLVPAGVAVVVLAARGRGTAADLVAVPVVSEAARDVAELAAGSPVIAPRPLGAPASLSWDGWELWCRPQGQRPAGFFLNGMEPSSLLTVILAGLSTAGSNSKRCDVGA